MQNKSLRNQILFLTTFLSLILASCSSPSVGDSIIVSGVDCHVFSRAAAGEGLTQAPIMSLSADGDM